MGLGEGDFVIVDGTLILTDRIAADELYCSQKHKWARDECAGHRPCRQDPAGVLPRAVGRTRDLTAARAHGIVQSCLTRQILVLADRACQGAGSAFCIPYYGHRELPGHCKRFNRRILRRARCLTNRISRIIQAVRTFLTCSYS